MVPNANHFDVLAPGTGSTRWPAAATCGCGGEPLAVSWLLVLRNGMMIGSAPVRLEGPVTGTSAFVRQSDESGAAAWLEVPIPEAIAAKVPERFAGRVDIAADLRALLEPLITVGTSVIVTPDSLRTSSPPPVEILGGDEGNAPAP